MKFDPIEMEVFKNIFLSIADEMGAVLGRTAFSPNIKERKDFSCALFNSRGESFAQGTHIPVHLGAMPLSVQTALEEIEFQEGDVVILNDPYRGGTHLPDITCITPLFNEGKLEFLIANRAHHSDVGGMTPGSMPLATEIFQEGLIIPPVKIETSDGLNEDLLNLLLSNVRTPIERKGDLLAQIAANRKGLSRLREVLAKYGIKRLKQYASYIQDYSEKVLKQTIQSIPDGSYRFEDYMDSDGISDESKKICVNLKISGGEAELDFTGTDPQTRGGINCNYAVTYSAVLYVFRALVQEEIPINSGLMRAVTIKAPKGCLVNAEFPAATAGGNVETSQRIVDVVLGALAKAIPKKIPAASQGTMNNIAFGGLDSKRGESFTYYETLGGGCGASSILDGMSGTHSHMTNSLNTPIEAMELYMPVKITKYALNDGTGGDGRLKGGDGLIREYEFLEPVNLTIISERRKYKPYGAVGGENGKPGKNIIVGLNGSEVEFGSKANLKLLKGEKIRIETPGGGGYGKKK